MDEEAHRAKNREASKRFRAKHPGYSAKKREAYRKAHPEKVAECARICARNYYHDHKDDPGYKEKAQVKGSQWFKNRFLNGGWALYRALSCRTKNKILGLEPTDITKDFILELFNKQDGKCFYTGVPFRLQEGIFSPSLDRKLPSIGYFKDNVVLCLAGVNYAKSDSTIEEFQEFLEELRQHLNSAHDTSTP